MSDQALDTGDARRDAILQGALGVFLRYGFKKTSMDDLARAVDLSRQGLYLHFPNKEALFKECVIFLTRQSLATARAALARDDLPLEERLLGAFVALKRNSDGSDMSQEHMAELFATATQLVAPALEELNTALVADLARTLEASGLAAKWQGAGLTAADLAQHLHAASHGIKHSVKTAAEYRDGMRVAVRLVCAK
ncbi:MAG: TetR/AcrR family transcriptional regulator [Pseudomonadota bacterium]